MQKRLISAEQKKALLIKLHEHLKTSILHFFDEKRAFTSTQIVQMVDALIKNEKIVAPTRDTNSFITTKLIPAIVKQNQQYFGYARFANVVPLYKSMDSKALVIMLENLYNFLRVILKTSATDTESADNFYKNRNIKEVLIDFNHARFGGSFNIESDRLVISIPSNALVAAQDIQQEVESSFRRGFTILDHEHLDSSIKQIVTTLESGHEYSIKLATNKGSTAREIFRRGYLGRKADKDAIATRIDNYVQELSLNGSGAQVFYIRVKDRTTP